MTVNKKPTSTAWKMKLDLLNCDFTRKWKIFWDMHNNCISNFFGIFDAFVKHLLWN